MIYGISFKEFEQHHINQIIAENADIASDYFTEVYPGKQIVEIYEAGEAKPKWRKLSNSLKLQLRKDGR